MLTYNWPWEVNLFSDCFVLFHYVFVTDLADKTIYILLNCIDKEFHWRALIHSGMYFLYPHRFQGLLGKKRTKKYPTAVLLTRLLISLGEFCSLSWQQAKIHLLEHVKVFVGFGYTVQLCIFKYGLILLSEPFFLPPRWGNIWDSAHTGLQKTSISYRSAVRIFLKSVFLDCKVDCDPAEPVAVLFTRLMDSIWPTPTP